MAMRMILGVLIMILALGICFIPMFSNCYEEGRSLKLENGKTVPMKCYWTAQAEIAIAAPLLALGLMMVIGRRRESLLALSVVGIVLGLSSLAIPTVLIGVCSTPTMICRTLMSPALLAMGALVVAACVIGLVRALTVKD